MRLHEKDMEHRRKARFLDVGCFSSNLHSLAQVNVLQDYILYSSYYSPIRPVPRCQCTRSRPCSLIPFLVTIL